MDTAYRRFINSAGNFWGLDACANRTAQDKLPKEKFAWIEGFAVSHRCGIWPKEQWGLDAEEIRQFADIGVCLEHGDTGEGIDAAMERFRRLVTSRSLGMVENAFQRFPLAACFAADRDVAGAEPSQAPPIAEVLGLEPFIEVDARAESPTSTTWDDRIQRALRFADDCGSGAALRTFVELAVQLGLQARGYRWTITITPPTIKALALIALFPRERAGGVVQTWVAPWAFAAHFPNIARERFDEVLGGIRGEMLDAAQLEDLGRRLKQLLQ